MCHCVYCMMACLCALTDTHRLSDWEQRYKTRDSKPEDVEAIIELRMIVGQQQQKMKDLVVRPCIFISVV